MAILSVGSVTPLSAPWRRRHLGPQSKINDSNNGNDEKYSPDAVFVSIVHRCVCGYIGFDCGLALELATYLPSALVTVGSDSRQIENVGQVLGKMDNYGKEKKIEWKYWVHEGRI